MYFRIDASTPKSVFFGTDGEPFNRAIEHGIGQSSEVILNSAVMETLSSGVHFIYQKDNV
jgi:hypothetical protein